MLKFKENRCLLQILSLCFIKEIREEEYFVLVLGRENLFSYQLKKKLKFDKNLLVVSNDNI